MRFLSPVRVLCGVVAAVLFEAASVVGQQYQPEAAVDRIFAKWNQATPGCAVAVASEGKTVVAKGYGMADLEHHVSILPDTIFEAGSVAKQFTAAAVLLLARNDKLSLDDAVRKYIPELPDYGAPLTIRHLLTHTSGIRDWGAIAAIAGHPRTTRVFTQADVLDIITRQRSLNFEPGSHWSYTNSGYNLAAIIVERVSGMRFAQFTAERIFEPLGMKSTTWRDDFTRIVPNRALAYSSSPDGFHTFMPFENAYGNGGLLTTVGDLLRWNQNFDSTVVGDEKFVQAQTTVATLNGGEPTGYALGLGVSVFKGTREISHDGSTAGYTADLLRLPDKHLSVAVLCNVSNADPAAYAHAVADLFMRSDGDKHEQPVSANALPVQISSDMVGTYRNVDTGAPYRLSADGARLLLRAMVGGPSIPLTPVAPTGFTTPFGAKAQFDTTHRVLRFTNDSGGTVLTVERVPPGSTSEMALDDFIGNYTSDEAETQMAVSVDRGTLVLRRGRDVFPLTPAYLDVFTNPQMGTVLFRRDPQRRVDAFSIAQDRVWNLRFSRLT
jgi:CubicO group peptidase (beta-lactamase class C family)